MKALYRRYRPKALADVIGQEHITTVLEKSIKNGNCSHAYLFVGPRGTGKTSVARILAHEINHFEYELEDDYLDIIEIDGASNRGIDDIRELRERANIAPTKGKYKIYIIDEVHMLTKEAFNALLKTLEEPPAHVVFIMATTDFQKVPITITSRSQIFTFKLANPSTMFDYLKEICKTEKISIDDDALKIVVKRGGGSFRDTLSLLDQVSTLSDETITAETIIAAFGLPRNESIDELLTAYKNNDLDTIRKSLTNLADTGIKAETIATELIDTITANPDGATLQLLEKLIDVTRYPITNPEAKLLLALCQNFSAPIAPRQIIQPPVAQKAAVVNKIPTPSKPSVVPAKAQPTEEKVQEATEPPKAPRPPVANAENASELWQAVLNHIAEVHPMLTSDLITSKYTLSDNKLIIYTGNYLKAKKLTNRLGAITEILPNEITVEITKESLNEDPEVANIAAIMGGGEEIQIDA